MEDLIGAALADYYYRRSRSQLWVEYADGGRELMPVAWYFRDEEEMPGLELVALQECRGRVLDVGAGAGSHALILQGYGLHVTAIDISPLAVEVMTDRGVARAFHQTALGYSEGAFDTILMLMNGIGLAGDLNGLRSLLGHLRGLLLPGGQLLFDTSDVAYLYKDKVKTDPDRYYGEIKCRYGYKRRKTDWFTWLYVDLSTLRIIANEEGWEMDLLLDDGEDQYLVRLTRTW
jgi:SAM-dependent methyltransferase